MKKITTILLVLLMSVNVVFASTPEFLTQTVTNCTADYDVKISFDNSLEIVQLLKELELSEEFEYFVDLEKLLSTLLSYDGTMNMQLDMSENYDKIQMAITSESNKFIYVNQNLNMDINTKLGMWLDMDLTSDEPVFDVIFQSPIMEKYATIDCKEYIEDPEFKEEFAAIFSKENIDAIQKMYADTYAEFATISGKGNKYTLKMDNDGFCKYIDKVFATLNDTIFEGGFNLPSFEGVKLLGKDGITVDVTLSGGKIKTEKIIADISVSLADISEHLLEEEWELQSDGVIDFTVEMEAGISKIGLTKVEFPVLTEENTYDLYDDTDYTYTEDYVEDYEEEDPYPYWYVGNVCEYMPVIDGEVYFPMRHVIASGFEDSVLIDYNNGIITMNSEYFGRYNTMEIDLSSDIILLDGEAYKSSIPVVINGTTYMNSTFFKDFFGWNLDYAIYDFTSNAYEYGFYTYNY